MTDEQVAEMRGRTAALANAIVALAAASRQEGAVLRVLAAGAEDIKSNVKTTPALQAFLAGYLDIVAVIEGRTCAGSAPEHSRQR